MLSIIIASYRSENSIEDTLNSFIKINFIESVDNQNCELILILDFPKAKELEIIEKYRKIIPNIKLIINSKRQGRIECNKLGLQVASKKYVLFISSTDLFKANFLEEVLKEISKNKPDLIEFKTMFQGLINWNMPLRFVSKIPVSISKNPEVITKISPILFNKVWKKKFLRTNWVNVTKKSNSRFFSNELFLLLPKINVFTSINKTLTTTIIPKSSQINTLRLIRVWDEVISYYKKNYIDCQDEIYYAFFYTISIFLMFFTSATKNTLLIKKQLSIINEKNKKLETIKSTNHYLQSLNKEANWLREVPKNNKYLKRLKKMR